MDCSEAQRIISERLDDDSVSPEQVTSAKEHCRACPDCRAYVRALVVVQRSTLPRPPDDLADRVMAAVREEAETSAVAPTQEVEETPAVVAEVPSPSSNLMQRFRAYAEEPRNRRTVVMWTSAAAALFVVATLTAIGGIRQITSDPAASRQAGTMSTGDDLSALSAAPDDSTSLESGGAVAESAAAAADYVVVGGVAYIATGPVSGVETSTLAPVGSTRSSLAVSGSPATRQVLGLNDPARVYIVNDAGELLGFDRVTREYRGKKFALASGELLAYGLWPTLPPGVAPPSNPNGMPEYVTAGADALGVEVFRPAAGNTNSGFAIAPGTPASDPASGNPGWTWWIPAR